MSVYKASSLPKHRGRWYHLDSNQQLQHPKNPKKTVDSSASTRITANPVHSRDKSPKHQTDYYIITSFNMNAAQTITRRMVTGMGPRLTAPVRHSSTAMTPKDRKAMRMIFTTGTLATVSGVAFGVSVVDTRAKTR